MYMMRIVDTASKIILELPCHHIMYISLERKNESQIHAGRINFYIIAILMKKESYYTDIYLSLPIHKLSYTVYLITKDFK